MRRLGAVHFVDYVRRAILNCINFRFTPEYLIYLINPKHPNLFNISYILSFMYSATVHVFQSQYWFARNAVNLLTPIMFVIYQNCPIYPAKAVAI